MSSHSAIRLLPEHLIDQIKAGEVVERPAALIKEILENSIDAGATHLELQIVDNGLSLISLEDNGHGMSFEDLPYAFARHATSKIKDYSDLFRLSSYGFRGEALASIASISRLTCTSANQQGHGGKIEIHGGETISHTPLHGARKGTSLFVRDLFYNTPARLKFVKSKTAEKNALKRTIDAFLLTAPKIHFAIRFDDQDKKIYPSCDNELAFVKRIEKLFFKKKDLQNTGHLLYESKHEYEGHEIHLHLSTQAIKGTQKQQFLFANDRLFYDKRFHQLITRSLPNLWGNESGHYVCYLKTPTDKIDVNVHPNKIEVKFMREDVIFALLKSALKDIDSISKAATAPIQTESSHYNTWDSGTNAAKSLNSPSTPHAPEVSSVTNTTTNDQLPIGFRWHPNDKNTIVNENQLVKICYQNILPLQRSSFTPLLINEPIFCDNRNLDLERMQEHGFELEWVDNGMLALRSIHSSLRSLPYIEMCRHAIAHIHKDNVHLYDDFKLTAHLPLAVLGRLLAMHSYDFMHEQKIVLKLDEANLLRIFNS